MSYYDDISYVEYVNDYYRAEKKETVMAEDRTKKYWKAEGCNTKFGTLKDAEDEAKKRAAKHSCDYDVVEFVSQAQAVVPDVPIVKIV